MLYSRLQLRRAEENQMTTRLFLTFASLLLVASMVGCKKEDTSKPATSNTNRAAQSTPDQFAATRGIFAKNCQNCHGATGDGGPVKLEDGSRLNVPRLRQGHAVRHGDPD